MSVMDMPRKSTSLPSIAQQLGKHGYHTAFYYGGDVNYSNMRSYFVGTGFQQIVSDADFPAKLHTGKWGVADGAVYDRMLADIKADHSGKPFFRSVMTESSHEPFDVPNYQKIKDNEIFNAFSYADHCLGQFISELKKQSCWKNTIVAIVPDHLGAYPDKADNYQWWRFKVPFILLGGALPKTGQCHTIGSQIDIAATLLGMLGIDHSAFLYSKDLLDAKAPHFAFFTFPDAMGIVTDNGRAIYDNTSGTIHKEEGADTELLVKKSKAYLQKLYDDLDKR
jgi:phosphoglycerol transferase MdoB-like AlkP superfamily enzyme